MPLPKHMSELRRQLMDLPYPKKLYFEWKHDIRYKSNNKPMNEERFLRNVGKKTLDSFIEWERSAQYRKLVALLLESRSANDLIEIYNTVSEKAKQGDDKAINTLLKLQKELKKISKEKIDMVEEEQEENDDLEL